MSSDSKKLFTEISSTEAEMLRSGFFGRRGDFFNNNGIIQGQGGAAQQQNHGNGGFNDNRGGDGVVINV